MLRALSTRRSHSRYERLVDESTMGLLEGQLKRAKSLPARSLGASRKLAPELVLPHKPKPAASKKAKGHPLFSLFDVRRRKKTTARPEFARYIEYVKEGGTWESTSNMPVMYYR